MTFSRSGKTISSDCFDNYSKIAIVMSPPAGTDINGDGIPDLIVKLYSGVATAVLNMQFSHLVIPLKRTDFLEGLDSPFEFKIWTVMGNTRRQEETGLSPIGMHPSVVPQPGNYSSLEEWKIPACRGSDEKIAQS